MFNKERKKLNSTALIGGSLGLALTLFAPSILAQEVKQVLDNNQETSKARIAEAEAREQEAEFEIIQVQGVRGALESALNTKRDAPSIVDAISASDINALPALDLGEALQAIPGIQLERSEEGRQSEISLRGLGGGFVKTTAAGQSFATPSRSFSDVGESNPFAAFEASVFDGVTVVKTPTADMQAGGIAGIVDQKLQRALSKPDGKYNVSVGGRYEDLTQNWDQSIKFQMSKHLIKDELAVAFKVAQSDQTFRRDTANFTNYAPLIGDAHGELDSNLRVNSETIDAYRAKYGIPDGAAVRSPSSVRNVTEFSDGDRISFTGNIEWRPINDLTLGANLMYTKRDLDSGTKQDAQFSAGYNENKPENSDRFYMIEPDMNTAPFLYDTTADGSPVYAVSKTSITDGEYIFTNRETTFFEEAKGLFLYGDYVTDNWVFNTVLTHSESENEFQNVGLDFRATGHHKAQTRVNGVLVDTVPTGIGIQLDSGQGDLGQASVSAQGWDDYNYDIPWVSSDDLASLSLTTADPLNGNKRLSHYVTGRIDNPKRKMSSGEFDAKRYVDFELSEFFNVGSVKFGVRYSREVLDNLDQGIGAAGINADAVSSQSISHNLVSDGQTEFFNGNFPGTFGADSGWQTIDNLPHIAALQNGMSDIEGGNMTSSGFYERFVGPHPQRYATNFSVEQTISAAYAMANLYGDIGNVPWSGNIGLRYVYTNNDFDGIKRDRSNGDILVPTVIGDDYDHWLPSLNLSFDLLDDLVLRTAYSEGFVRPNLRVMTPTTDVQGGNANANVTLPASFVKPYDANNYDLSLEWYNREGSAVSVGVFYKELTGFFEERESCPEGDQLVIDALGSDIEREDNPATGGFTCTQVEPYIGDDGDEYYRSVVVKEIVNDNDTIKLTGVEFAVQQKLDFLPYPWNGFGGVFNYTYIDQDGTEDSQLYKVAPESFNLIGYYENDGFSARLAYNWKDDSYIKGDNSYLGVQPRVQQANGRLDLVTSYAFTKNFRGYLRGYNLTDEQRYEYWGNNEKAVSRVDYTGRIYEVSFSYSF
ncbi:TonB-dependent receptor [Pseudoalteromonas sp. S1727]|uniref:TonB-dependent receptor n=1 Tax=Pseudoalteromonas sp. S1727 TaxID=2066514 RepID=UPI0011090383|nr:TonB-dependent receptor [Pseudoalteromonas sp. S1727]TMN74132.1 TonB-dependent receptor [Pseudoalteromonas sp. S1727]